MKSKFLTILFNIILFSNIFSQARLGFTEKEIRDEFNFLSWNESSVGYFDYSKSITSKLGNNIVQYIFDYYGRCVYTIVKPINESEFQKRVSRYNSECKKIFENHWLDKSEIHIQIMNDDTGKFFLFWKTTSSQTYILTKS